MNIFLPGFADPVAEAQTCFRAVLDAMARPGSIHAAGTDLQPPAPLDAATAAVLLTLCDADTNLHLAGDCTAAAEWVAFHCGAGMAGEIGQAGFVVATRMPDFSTMSAGTDDGPEESATLILQVRGFGRVVGQSGGTELRLRGPGLRDDAVLLVDGLPDGFVAAWAANHALFPRGIDLILCAGNQLAALPRSARVEG